MCVLSQPQSAAPGPALAGQGPWEQATSLAPMLGRAGQDPIGLKGLCVLPAVAGAVSPLPVLGKLPAFLPATHMLQPVEPESRELLQAETPGSPASQSQCACGETVSFPQLGAAGLGWAMHGGQTGVPVYSEPPCFQAVELNPAARSAPIAQLAAAARFLAPQVPGWGVSAGPDTVQPAGFAAAGSWGRLCLHGQRAPREAWGARCTTPSGGHGRGVPLHRVRVLSLGWPLQPFTSLLLSPQPAP